MAMPLEDFPPEHRARVQALVDLPERPPRYFAVGAPGSPRPLAYLESRAWWEWHWQRGLDPDLARTPLSRSLRDQVLARDGLICGICAQDVDPGQVHIDHIFPVSRGGRDVLSNLRVTHARCNLRKGARVDAP